MIKSKKVAYILISIIIVVGIVAGTVLIAVISDALDNWWEEKEEEWFN